jgi:hypothetical protein
MKGHSNHSENGDIPPLTVDDNLRVLSRTRTTSSCLPNATTRSDFNSVLLRNIKPIIIFCCRHGLELLWLADSPTVDWPVVRSGGRLEATPKAPPLKQLVGSLLLISFQHSSSPTDLGGRRPNDFACSHRIKRSTISFFHSLPPRTQ